MFCFPNDGFLSSRTENMTKQIISKRSSLTGRLFQAETSGSNDEQFNLAATQEGTNAKHGA
jgi:hypothetical protein